MPARLLILKLFSRQHALILHSVFIHSNIFDQNCQNFMFFRLQYAHFWALILVSIKFSMRHVYHFHKFFQQACLFRPARLFRTLEYIKSAALLLNRRLLQFNINKDFQMKYYDSFFLCLPYFFKPLTLCSGNFEAP